MALRINPPLELNKSLDLALVAPEILRHVVVSLAIVGIDMFLIETGKLIEVLLLLNEPVVDEDTELGVEVSGLKDST